MGKKVVAFDIFGTCFGKASFLPLEIGNMLLIRSSTEGFDNLIQALDEEFGAEIKQAGTTPAHVMMAW